MEHVKYHLSGLLDDLEFLCEVGAPPSPVISTGFPSLDEVTGGLGSRGWVIRGEPGVGTSSLALQLCRSVLISSPHPPSVLYVTNGLTGSEVVRRLLAGVGHVPMGRLGAGRLAPYHWRAISDAMRSLGSWPLWVVEAHDWSVQAILLAIQQAQLTGARAFDWIVLDSLDRVGRDPRLDLTRFARDLGFRMITVVRTHAASSYGRDEVIVEITVDGLASRSVRVIRGALLGMESPAPVPLSLHPHRLSMQELTEPLRHPGQQRLQL